MHRARASARAAHFTARMCAHEKGDPVAWVRPG